LIAKKEAARSAPVVREHVAADWIGTAEAARLSGYSPRRIASLCDEGFFVEGVDWRQRPPKEGCRCGGFIRIRKAALAKLDGFV
jgi:hypothetical protein